MNRGWIGGILAVIVVIAIGAAVANNAYQAGLAQGLTQSSQPGAQPQPGIPYYYGPWHYGWFGHGFGFFGFLLFLFLIFAVIRGLFFWGRGGPGYRHRGPGGSVPPWFEEWHRRAHEGKQDAGTA